MGFDEDKVATEGAAELDIVYSGLEEIMQHAVQENWQFAIDQNLSFRNACFVNAIQKVHRNRMETGMMIWVVTKDTTSGTQTLTTTATIIRFDQV